MAGQFRARPIQDRAAADDHWGVAAVVSRILLVDDEPFLLEALEMLLRRQRPQWAVRLAPGPAEALDELAAEPADVIVSDLGMPGMDGAALLEQVSRRHPATVRVLLSGLGARELAARGAAAHVSLQKPCDTRTLCEAIERAALEARAA
jgi:DNA-binding NtrC family response regulator